MDRARGTAMKHSALPAVCAFASLLGVATSAHAGRCHRAEAAPRGPIGLTLGAREPGLFHAAFGAPPPACAYGSFGLDLRAGVLVSGANDTPNLYGAIAAEVLLHGSVPLNDRVWFTASWGVLEYRELHNATVVSRTTGLGAFTLGAHVRAAYGTTWQLAPFVRALVIPGMAYSIGAGLEPGLAALWAPGNRVGVLASFSLPISTALRPAPAAWVAFAHVSAELALRPLSHFEVALGAEARFGLAPDVGLASLAPVLGLRLHGGSHGYLQLAAMLPLLGSDATLGRIGLGYVSTW